MRALLSSVLRPSRWAPLLLGGGGLGLVIAACNVSADPPGLAPSTAATSGAGGAGGEGDFVGVGGSNTPPKPDAGGLCGQLITQIHKDPPNLYFVLDVSGSMATPVGPSTRYSLVRAATLDLVQTLGGLINVGAALFPRGVTQNDACHIGGEVFPVTPGDALDLATFASLIKVTPFGGTPTAGTLEALYPTLTQLPGRTIVVLATDGGPNCNVNATCGAAECMDNIEGSCFQNMCCAPSGPNCCAVGKDQAQLNCVDQKPSVDAVAKLAAAGVRVYVVGTPGSEAYGAVLDQMALASGAPQIAPPFYYKVEDYSSLTGTLASIAAIEVSCDFDLTTPPPDPSLVNVYLDNDVLLQDLENGWVWKAATAQSPKQTIELRGLACQRLKSGLVKQVQIAAGCPTMASK